MNAVEAEPATPCRCVRALLPALKPDYAEIVRRADLDEAPRAHGSQPLDITTTLAFACAGSATLKSQLEVRSAGCCEGGQTCGCVRER